MPSEIYYIRYIIFFAVSHGTYDVIHDGRQVSSVLIALTAVGALMTLIDFTLSNARGFCSSMGNPLAVKGLNFLKAGNSEKNGPAKVKPFGCVLEHAYIKCIHFQLFLLKIWET